MTFLEEFMSTAAKDAETPRSFFYWSALAAVSAVVKRNVWIQRPTWRTYPNIFIFLVADSGLRKGIPINLAKDLVSAVGNTRIISGRSSMPGIIQHLGTAYTNPDGTVIDKAYGYISSSEFSASIVRDPDSLTILTDLYDSCYHDRWKDMLRGNMVELVEPSITLLAGINPPHFDDYISPTALTGGFVGRLLLVFEQEKACSNPAIREVAEELQFKKDPLITRLKEIAKLKGAMRWAPEAMNFYEDWYFEFDKKQARTKSRDKTGSINRIGENVLKVAILISLSRSLERIITVEDVEQALISCTTTLSNASRITAGQGKTEFASQTKLVMAELLRSDAYEMSRRKLLNLNYGDISASELDKVIDTLEQAGVITITRGTKDHFYQLTKEAVLALEHK